MEPFNRGAETVFQTRGAAMNQELRGATPRESPSFTEGSMSSYNIQMIKRTKADKWFSDCVRIREDWHCENCKMYFPLGSRKDLHCSHYVPRGNKTVRHFPFNAFAHCKNCHVKLGGGPRHISKFKTVNVCGNPAAFYQHYIDVFNAEYAEAVNRLSTISFRNFKVWEDDIANHYKSEYKRMDEMRKDGETGRIEIEPWLGAHPVNFWGNILHELTLERVKDG